MTKNRMSLYGDAEGPENFVWPEFTKERDRIRFYSQKFKDVDYVDALNEVYGTNIKDCLSNQTPQELNIGDKIYFKISSISKNNVTIENCLLKEDIQIKNNLNFFSKFSNYRDYPCTGLVIKKDNKKTVVDVVAPLVNEWKYDIITNNKYQYDLDNDNSLLAKNLKLVKGGYLCKLEVPGVTDVFGETIDAFIPGSQIVLNIENDFSCWENKSVRVFVTNFMAASDDPSKQIAICSVKKYKEFLGRKWMLNAFKEWTENTKLWEEISKETLNGVVTGVINSAKNCGIFIEIPNLNITGMISAKPYEIVKYAPRQNVQVSITGFDIPTYYNDEIGQTQHIVPYEIEETPTGTKILTKFLLKPLFVFV